MARSDFRFYHRRRVEYADTDRQGIVFNSNYLRYFDTAVTEYLRALGYDYHGISLKRGEDFHTVKASVEFLGPIHFDAVIDIHVRAARLGRSSLLFVLEIYREGEEETLIRGEILWVNANQKSHKSAPVPEELISLLREKEGDRLTMNNGG